MAPGWIDAGGVSLRFALTGSGKDVVVLLHEMGGTMESWDLVEPSLARDYRVLRFDMRGAGLSEKIRCGMMDGDQLADDLAALLDAVGEPDRPVALVGCAVGANVALRFAARYPARTASLVLSSPATGIPAERRQAALDNVAGFLANGLRSIEVASLLASYAPVLRDAVPARFTATRLRWLANDPASFAATFRMLIDSDLSAVLPAVTAPALFIGCSLDAVRSAEGTQRVAEQVPGAEFVEVRSGHFLAIQSPEAFLDAVLPFLARHKGRFTRLGGTVPG